MAKSLTEKTTKLSWILRLTNAIPPSKIDNALKLSTFRRALKLGLKKYSDGVDSLLDVYKKDAQEYNENVAKAQKVIADEKATKKEKEEAEKSVVATNEAITALQKEADEKLAEYAKENDKEQTVVFDNEAFEYTKNLFGEVAKDIFGQYTKDKDGNIKNEAYDTNAADTLFELLEKAK